LKKGKPKNGKRAKGYLTYGKQSKPETGKTGFFGVKEVGKRKTFLTQGTRVRDLCRNRVARIAREVQINPTCDTSNCLVETRKDMNNLSLKGRKKSGGVGGD